MGRPRTPRAVDDAGETLVESLVSIVVMGIAVLAILGAIGMSATASDQHRDQATAQNLLRLWAEELTYLGNCGSDVPEPSWADTDAAGGYSPDLGAVDVEYWDDGQFQDGCGGDDAGLQRVELAVSGPVTLPGGTTLSVVLRDSCEVASC